MAERLEYKHCANVPCYYWFKITSWLLSEAASDVTRGSEEFEAAEVGGAGSMIRRCGEGPGAACA